jgi:Holliday junction DNA helicase RuvA
VIAFLQGTLAEVGPDFVVLLTGGVGYQVFVSKSTLRDLPAAGEALSFKVVTVVREDSFNLYGFPTSLEKELFLKLLQVSGIGPKVAMTILSGLAPHDFAEAIGKEDLLRLTAIPGVGKKTAERLVVELKDKMLGLVASGLEATERTSTAGFSPAEEAISALTNLGYTRQEALRALKSIPKASDLPLEVLVREGLKALS